MDCPVIATDSDSSESACVEAVGDVEALLLRPNNARSLLVLARRAGAGMHHTFMESLARELAGVNVGTFRYQFPYMQQRRGRPDAPALLTATVQAAVKAASDAASDLMLLAGGKSLGGRMTSLAFADGPSTVQATAPVRGLVFFGFPLHPPGRPGTQRADHLTAVQMPMLFLQGTRDTFADLTLLRPVCETGASCHLTCGGCRGSFVSCAETIGDDGR